MMVNSGPCHVCKRTGSVRSPAALLTRVSSEQSPRQSRSIVWGRRNTTIAKDLLCRSFSNVSWKSGQKLRSVLAPSLDEMPLRIGIRRYFTVRQIGAAPLLACQG